MSTRQESGSIFAGSDSLHERPRSLASVQLSRLDWSNANNAAISLRVLAEMVRRGDVACDVSKPQDELVIGVREVGRD